MAGRLRSRGACGAWLTDQPPPQRRPPLRSRSQLPPGQRPPRRAEPRRAARQRGRRVGAWIASVAVVACGCSAAVAQELVSSEESGLPFEYSKDVDVYNQGVAVKYFEEQFYTAETGLLQPSLNESQLLQVDTLRLLAFDEPSLALAAAQVLYMFGWFRPDGQIIRENVVAAAALFERSISASDCMPNTGSWVDNACDIRWMHAMLLYNWLGDTEPKAELGQAFSAKARRMLELMREAPHYKEVKHSWTSPELVNFNSIIFKGKPSRPIWNTQEVEMGRFLEDNHNIFKAELEAILREPGDIYGQLMRLDPSREHLATPGGWDTLRIVRYHHWFDVFCELAPITCELIRSRPEITKCNFMNVNYVRLNPGAHLKPHFGNGPRLSAHLSVIAPEPLRAGMQVGNQKMLWMEGKAIIFDDTYPHCVSHWGSKPRYVMLVWFCHPCDTNNEHGQVCPRI